MECKHTHTQNLVEDLLEMSVCAPSSGCGSTQSVTSPSEEKKQHTHQNGHRRVRQEKSGAMASSQGKNELRFADWMASLPESIQSMPLTNLAIPGKWRHFSFNQCKLLCKLHPYESRI